MFNKKSKMGLLAIQLLATTPLFAGDYTLDDIDQESYQVRYNKLPAVEESDHQLKQRSTDFSQFLVDAGQIVTKYEMEGNVGLRLIHNHFPVAKGEIMVEELQTIKGISSLVTYAQALETAQAKKATPASWIFSEKAEEDPVVFEATTDPAVHAGIKLLEQKPEFMNEMGDLLRRNRFTSLLSVAVLKKESLVASEGEMFLEINEAAPQKSVVQVWKADQKPTDAIRTSWSFGGAQDGHCLAVGYCQPIFAQHLHLTYHQHM